MEELEEEVFDAESAVPDPADSARTTDRAPARCPPSLHLLRRCKSVRLKRYTSDKFQRQEDWNYVTFIRLEEMGDYELLLRCLDAQHVHVWALLKAVLSRERPGSLVCREAVTLNIFRTTHAAILLSSVSESLSLTGSRSCLRPLLESPWDSAPTFHQLFPE